MCMNTMAQDIKILYLFVQIGLENFAKNILLFGQYKKEMLRDYENGWPK